MCSRSSLGVLGIAVLATALLAVWPRESQAAPNGYERGWVLRVSPTWVDSDRGDGLVIGYDGGFAGLVTGDVGLNVAGEYRFSPRLGLDVGVLAISNGTGTHYRDGLIVSSGTSALGSFTLGPAIHLTPESSADLFFGPFLAITARSDVGYRRDELAGVRVGSSLGWGAVLGVDVPIGERGWRLCTSVRYIDTNLEGRDGNGNRYDLGFDPTAVGVGVGYRF